MPRAERGATLSGFSHDGRLVLTTDQVEQVERQPDQLRGAAAARGGFGPRRVTTFAALSVWDASRESDALVKRWPGIAEAAFSPTKPVLAIFETVQSNRPRGPGGAAPVSSSRLGFWDFAAPK